RAMHALSAPGLTLRAAAPEDEAGVLALFERTFGRPLALERWRWRLRRRPTPVPNVFLVFDGARPVFQYAGIPVAMRVGGRDVLAIERVDTLADPDYQRCG